MHLNFNFLQFMLVIADHLIELMGMGLALALMFRLLASRSSRRDQIYFKTFARGVEKTLGADESLQKIDKNSVDDWLGEVLNKVMATLPDRSLRFGRATERASGNQYSFRERENFAEFAEGKKSIIHGIRSHGDVLKSAHPPNFSELAYRILDQDRQWKTVGGVPIETVSRMLDILPGLFVIGGILGTFIGIATALPKIGAIDLNHITESNPVMASFIDSIALSMRTSIAGITYSVLMTMLNALFPVHTQRADVEKNVQRCLELLWNRIHGERVSIAESRIISLLRDIRERLTAKEAPGSPASETGARSEAA